MSFWIVYSKDGITERCRTEKLQYSGEFMGACSVSISVVSPTPIVFEIGDYIIYRDERFEINYDPSVTKISSVNTYGEGFSYENVVFNSLSDELTRCDFLDYVSSDNLIHYSSLPTFSFFADSIEKLIERIQANLDRVYKDEKKWTVVKHQDYNGNTNVNISVNNITVWDALAFVNTQFGSTFIIKNRTITIGTAGIAMENVFSYGKDNGLSKIERNAESNQKIITRLRAYGSTRNMPKGYYHNTDGSNMPNNMAVNNLMLPGFPDETHDPYIDSENIESLGVREGTVFFDGSGELEEIYPSMSGITAEDLKEAGEHLLSTGELDVVLDAEQISDNGKFEEGDTIPPFTITLKDIGFDINDYLSTSSATISMKDGMCGGREFEIASCKQQEDGTYLLTCNRSEDTTLDLYFPYSDYQIKSGDKFVLLNIEMPDVYVKAAAQRLLDAAKAYLAKNDYVRYSYSPTVDNIYMARQHDEAMKYGLKSIHDTIKEGDLMLFEDIDLGISGNIIIDSLTIKEDLENSLIPEYEITLKNEKTVGTIEKLQNQIDSIGRNGSSGVSFNTGQITSIVKAIGEQTFLRKDKNDRTPYNLGVKSLSLGEKPINDIIRDIDAEKPESSDETVYSSKMADKRIEEELKPLDDKYIRKDQDDSTEYSIGIGGNLTVGGDGAINGNGSIEGNTELKGELFVKGKATLGSDLDVDGNVSLGGTLDVEGDSSLKGKLNVEGETVINNTFKVQDDTTLNGVLSVKGDTQLSSNLNVEGEASIGGTISVDGKATFNDDISAIKDINVNGSIGLRGKQIAGFTRYYDEEKPEYASDVDFYSALMTDKKIDEKIKGLDDKYLRKDKDDTAHEHITFEKGITVYDIAKTMNLEVEELATIAKAIVNTLSSSTFVDGFSGEGFQIWKDIATGDWSLTIDRVTVRKMMVLYELIIQKIRSAGGMIVVSAGNGRIKTVERVGSEYKFTFEDGNTFQVNDLMRCQVFSPTGLKYYWVEITHVLGESVYARVADFLGVIPSIGDECVLMGNTKNTLRQNLILISATEDGKPRFDCLDGVKTKSFEGCLKVRVGCLDGIQDDRFPSDLQPQGYGLYGNNCYLTGVFVLSNGNDVLTQFAIMEGMIRSEISSVRSEINAKDNYLSNASFASNLELWSFENDVRVFNTSGGLLHFNNNFYSIKENFAGVVAKDTKNVLRIKNSFITQKNSDYNLHPSFDLYVDEETEESYYRPRMFYVSFKYMCTKGGTLTVKFKGENNDGSFEIYESFNISEYIVPNVTFTQREFESKWNGTGDFYLSFDGDIYIYDLALSDNKLADVEEKFTMRFEATDKKIQANLEQIIKNDKKVEEYYSELKLTAESLESTFNKSLENQYEQITEEYTGEIIQTAESLTSDYQKLVRDEKADITESYQTLITQTATSIKAELNANIENTRDGLIEDYEAKIEASAESLTSDYNAAITDLKNGTIKDMQSSITQQANLIATKVSQTEFDKLGNRVTNAESSITQNANLIATKVSQTEFDQKTGEYDGSISSLEQRADGLDISVSNINNTIGSMQGTLDDALDDIEALDKKTAEFEEEFGEFMGDGLITTAEAIAIEKYINTLDAQMADINSTYEKIYEHKYLSGTPKTNLKSLKTSLDSAYNSLVSTINSVISDGKATTTEIANVDSKFDAFNTAIDNYNDALQNARDAITEYFANRAVDLAEEELYNALPDDYKTQDGTYASALVQMAEGISAVAGRFDEDGKLIEGAGWVTTSQGNTLWATKNEFNELGEIVAQNKSQLSVQSDNITSLVAKTDELGTQYSEVKQTADGIKTTVSGLDGRLTTVETTANGLTSRVQGVEGNISTLQQTDTDIRAEITAVDGRYSSLKVEVDALKGAVGDGEINMEDFSQALEGLSDRITGAQNTADEALEGTKSNLSLIELNSDKIQALSGSITLDSEGNITNINTSGLVLEDDYASLFTAEMNAQGVVTAAKLETYVKKDDLGNPYSGIDISADLINLTGKVTFSDLSESAKASIQDYSTDAISDFEEALGLAALADKTIISGGYIKTSLINANALTIKGSQITGFTPSMLGLSDWVTEDTITAALEGETIIVGGYIKTDLINAGALTIRSGQVTGLGDLATKDSITTEDLGLADWVKAATLTAAMTGETIIVGGYIKTDLINTSALRISSSNVDGLGLLATKDDINTSDLGLSDWVKKATVQAAMESETIIVGGYIKTSLIDVDAITIGSNQVTGLDNALDSLSDGLDGKADISLSNAIINGKTLIAGGYINTELIEASELRITSSQVNGLGALATKDSISTDELDQTIISGGYIKTNLIDAESLTVSKLQATSSGYTYSLDANGFNIKNSDSVSLCSMYVSNYVSLLRMDSTSSNTLIKPGSITLEDSNANVGLFGSGLALYSGASISGLAVKNISTISSSDVDFLKVSGSSTLPDASTWKGKVIFVKKTGGTLTVNNVYTSSGTSSTSSKSNFENGSRFFISDGTYWHEFKCF